MSRPLIVRFRDYIVTILDVYKLKGTSFSVDLEHTDEIEIIKLFTYLGIVFTTGGYFVQTYEALSGQALKEIFKQDISKSSQIFH